jgi:hypothetical protein
MPRKSVRRLTRRQIAPTGGRGSEGGDLGATRLTWTGNREGTRAWRESTEVEKASKALPCKARVIRRRPDCFKPSLQRWRAHPATRRLRSQPPASDGSRFPVSTLPVGGRRATSPLKETDQAAYVTLDTSGAEGNSGWPTGREPHGHGARIVVAGVTTGRGVRESRTQGEVAQVS